MNLGVSAELESLSSLLGLALKGIRETARETRLTHDRLSERLTSNMLAGSGDTCVVLYGSLARNEYTPGSDVDWTLLIDGPANPEHRKTANVVKSHLDDLKLRAPGKAGAFGQLAFSHELVHQIGGQDDTNRNTTQRILLLLESVPVLSKDLVWDRVVRQVLRRYLEDDASIPWSHGPIERVPRFLLNDIVRFWRTMAVDFANKRAERAGDGWALRMTKLRMSRKLVFAKGLLCCFSCATQAETDQSCSQPDSPVAQISPDVPGLQEFILPYLKTPALELLAQEALRLKLEEKTARQMFGAYDQYLETLLDAEKRKKLEKLSADNAHKDALYTQMRTVCHSFDEALTKFFFDNERLCLLTRKYGVF